MNVDKSLCELIRVLVVDDHMMMRGLVTQNLRTLGIQNIETAMNGADALKMILEKKNAVAPYHIVFLDWNMPVMTGMEVLKACRADKRFEDMAIVMLTAEQEQKNVLDALRMGATSYLVKPVSHEIFEKNMTKVFEWLEKKNIAELKPPPAKEKPKDQKQQPLGSFSKDVEAELRPVIAKGIENIFSTLFSVKIMPVDYAPDPSSKALICVGRLCQNDTLIKLRFYFDQELLKPLLMQLYAPDFLEDNKVYEDAACEIVNILCSQIKAFLNQRGYDLVTDFPEMASKNPDPVTKDPVFNIHFALNDEKYFLVDVSAGRGKQG